MMIFILNISIHSIVPAFLRLSCTARPLFTKTPICSRRECSTPAQFLLNVIFQLFIIRYDEFPIKTYHVRISLLRNLADSARLLNGSKG
jgi:hypothetical protein